VPVSSALAAMFKHLALLVPLLAAISAFAQTSVPLSVSTVLTAGYWQSNGQSGRYRIIITEEGWEHVTNRLLVEWIADPANREQDSTVVASIEPVLPFGQSVAAFSVTAKHLGVGCLKISLTGVVSVDPSSKVAAELVANSPGNVIAANPVMHRTCAKSRASR
jgi:hypothetical protein